MKLTIDIQEKAVYKWGAVVITNISPDPAENLEVALPGFKYIAKEENPAFVINRKYGDVRDNPNPKPETKSTKKKK